MKKIYITEEQYDGLVGKIGNSHSDNEKITFKTLKDETLSASWSLVYKIFMFLSNIKIGSATVEIKPEENKGIIKRVEVIPDFKYMGYGKKLYYRAKNLVGEFGFKLYGDSVQSDDARALWGRFENRKLTKKDNNGDLYLK